MEDIKTWQREILAHFTAARAWGRSTNDKEVKSVLLFEQSGSMSRPEICILLPKLSLGNTPDLKLLLMLFILMVTATDEQVAHGKVVSVISAYWWGEYRLMV